MIVQMMLIKALFYVESYFFRSFPLQYHQLHSSHGFTALWQAAATNHVQVVKLLFLP